ncbi:Trk system potassium transporter TrkA [Azonexus hydrophilus]|uniref:Trk system potassium transporter TrkA n=1 Tax=Azonexus hydrophilus TaxID=418702 RepID=UPI002491E631|nr:Trk system potassium transporter TrkA [Azonexus hydrophilus]
MNILILGAGQVGASLAEALVSEANDITLVDLDAVPLAQLADRLDVRTVNGNAAFPSVLREAGVESADLLVAVTQSDQSNLVACKLAHSRFAVPTRIARLRSADFLDPALLSTENFAVDFALCPEQEISDYIAKLVEYPEALQVVEFAEGRVVMVGVRAYEGGLLVGKPIRAMRDHLPAGVDARIAAIFRDTRAIDANGDTLVQAGDEVFLLAASEHIRTVLKELRRMQKPARKLMIAGAGNVGARVARRLEGQCEVTVIENRAARASLVAGWLDRAQVINGEATDENLLIGEDIAETDMFLALTNDDENNIMAASLAKRLGCRRVLALINREAYADMVQGGPIDIGLSPAQVSIGSLLTHVRQADVARVHSLRRGAAEALELVVRGDRRSSQVVGRRIEELPPLRGASIAAVVRSGQVIIPHHDTLIESGDHVIVFCTRKRHIAAVEKLFQPVRSLFSLR